MSTLGSLLAPSVSCVCGFGPLVEALLWRCQPAATHCTLELQFPGLPASLCHHLCHLFPLPPVSCCCCLSFNLFDFIFHSILSLLLAQLPHYFMCDPSCCSALSEQQLKVHDPSVLCLHAVIFCLDLLPDFL